jgi:hypothetical protein
MNRKKDIQTRCISFYVKLKLLLVSALTVLKAKLDRMVRRVVITDNKIHSITATDAF